ncbi:hypothetical protein BGZ57DRAFT_727489, partial [Hyaloscypha finlandica]
IQRCPTVLVLLPCQTSSLPIKQTNDDRDTDVPTELAVLLNDSRPMTLDRSEIEPVEAVETQRESSGHAPIAGVGDVEGDGDSLRKDGCALSSGVVAMIA